MILVECCAMCKYYKDGKCMNRNSYNAEVTGDDWCDDWKEQEDDRD